MRRIFEQGARMIGVPFGSVPRGNQWQFGVEGVLDEVGNAVGYGIKKTAKWGGIAAAATVGLGVVLPGALIGAVGIGLDIAAARGLRGVLGGYGKLGLGGGVLQTAGLGAVTLGAGAAGLAYNTALGGERLARTIFTGGIQSFGRKDPIHAWFPFMGQEAFGKGGIGLQKWAPNPSIARRMVGIAAAGAIIGGMKDVITSSAPAPSYFFDGRTMHAANDLGANANYGHSLIPF